MQIKTCRPFTFSNIKTAKYQKQFVRWKSSSEVSKRNPYQLPNLLKMLTLNIENG